MIRTLGMWTLGKMGARAAALCVVAAAAVLGGCGGHWARNYSAVEPLSQYELQSGFAATPTDAKGKPRAIVRHVEWPDMQRALDALDATPVAGIRGDAFAASLAALNVGAPPEDVRLVGLSRFVTTDDISATNGQLAKFAAEQGATHVVWSVRPLRMVDEVESHTVSSYGHRYSSYDGHDRDSSYNETHSVPVVVRKWERDWAAWLLRLP